MTIRVYARAPGQAIEEITDALDVTTLEVTENAEEGSVAISRVTLDDPDMVITMRGHRDFWILEDEIYGEENGLFRGYTADRTYSRGKHPLGREVQVAVADANTVWQRRVMVGADCKRPAETDVQRMQWLVTTAEAGLIHDETTYLATGSPVNMDACDYRGQMMASVADDCGQASGKNWWLSHDFVNGDGYFIWYGHQALEAYDSALRLSNLLDEIDDVTTFAISDDTTLQRDPSRVFAGVYLPYDGGAVYRQLEATAEAFARRDAVMPSANVKTNAKAVTRALRYLADLDEETDRITTTVILPAALVNGIRPGMRVQFKATHFEAYPTEFRWVRVLSRTVAYWAPGQYKVTLVLDGPGEAAVEPEPPIVGCGIDESDAFVCIAPTYSAGGPYTSIESGPTFTLQTGQVYRLLVEIDSIVRAAPRCMEAVQANIGSLEPVYYWSINPGITVYDFAMGVTYAGPWATWNGPETVGYVHTFIYGSGGPASAAWHLWVECGA